MSYLDKLIAEIAPEMGKTPQDLARFGSILSDNLLDTQETLADTKLEDLEALKIPKVLAKKIIEKASQKQAPKSQPAPQIPENKRLAQVNNKLQKVFREFISDNERVESLEMLTKVLGNIHANPTVEKYKKLNMSNGILNMTLFRHLEIFDLLLLLGFSRMPDGFLVLNDYDEALFSASIQQISDELNAAKKRPKHFDPFAPSFSSNNPNFSVDNLKKVSDFTESSFDQKLRDLIAKRDALVQNHKVTPKIVPVAQSATQTSHSHHHDDDVSDDLRPGEELRIFRQAILDFQKNFFGEANFQSAKKKEFEKLAKEPLVLETTLRLKSPKGVFDATFAAHDSLKSVFEVLAKFFGVDPQAISASVFVNRYFWNSPASQKSLKELNLVPNAILELNFL